MEVTVSNEERPDFLPFTLNMRLTSKESAHNLYELLKPIVYARPTAKKNQPVSVGINQEQRQIAEDICNVLSAQVRNI
jgi:hypothetical protein